MTAADLIAQGTILVFILLAIAHRSELMDMTDGNVERLIREEQQDRDAAEAQSWLNLMGAGQ